MRFNIKAFALTSGIVWGAGVFLLTWWLILRGATTGGMSFLERVYIGYAMTPVGSLIGTAWGFVDALIAGAIFAWLYNLLADRFGSNA